MKLADRRLTNLHFTSTQTNMCVRLLTDNCSVQFLLLYPQFTVQNTSHLKGVPKTEAVRYYLTMTKERQFMRLWITTSQILSQF
jgi:hypothetical protein